MLTVQLKTCCLLALLALSAGLKSTVTQPGDAQAASPQVAEVLRCRTLIVERIEVRTLDQFGHPLPGKVCLTSGRSAGVFTACESYQSNLYANPHSADICIYGPKPGLPAAALGTSGDFGILQLHRPPDVARR